MKSGWLWGIVICLMALVWPAGMAAADDAYAETSILKASEAQRNNIILAAQAIDGVRLDFGDTFSFNEIVGERCAERGFAAAAIAYGKAAVSSCCH